VGTVEEVGETAMSITIPKKITFEDVVKLQETEPIVYHCLMMHRLGTPIEDTLYACIYLLAKKAKAMEKAATDAINNSPHTYLLYRDTKPQL
jgi:hypothetical protein